MATRGEPNEYPGHYLERIILGPCMCQGCGKDVVYCVRPHLVMKEPRKHRTMTAVPSQHLGWLHDNGSYKCPKPGPKLTKGV